MRVVLTVRAEADIDAIAAFVFTRNPRAAHRVEAELQAALKLIGTYPLAGREMASASAGSRCPGLRI